MTEEEWQNFPARDDIGGGTRVYGPNLIYQFYDSYKFYCIISPELGAAIFIGLCRLGTVFTEDFMRTQSRI
jgi:hypothetical protein